MNTAYRVWDGEQMYYGDDEGLSLIISGEDWGLYRNFGAFIRIASSKQKNSALMWGIGLKDKEGKEIYHKDFFKFEDGTIGIVEWIEEKAMFNVPQFYKPGADYPSLAFNENDHCFGEVIGDVYQNPELLEGLE
ncbi:YopX family protein [Bacillus halotolerans]|uniref:YopX family protein n=1 Tax=Bacillus halotolerans TaxID=260554 RepID=UPI0020CCEC31|nr:YopX family protein [Bacillus halotolerans]MCP9298401.1 YopX family protein [Bacillus halotolerans]